MTYIDYLNDFHRWLESHELPVRAQTLYIKLLHVFNRAGWPELVSVDNLRLMSMAGVESKRAMIHARDALVEAGFLAMEKGKPGYANQYRLRSVYDTEDDAEKVTEDVTESVTENVTRNVARNVSEKVPLNKTKTKTKKKTVPLCPPAGETGFGEELAFPDWLADPEEKWRMELPCLLLEGSGERRSALEGHPVGAQDLLAGDGGGVFRRQGLAGIADPRLRGDGGEGLPQALAMGPGDAEVPGEGAVAELLAGRHQLREAKLRRLAGEEAAAVVLLGGAAALNADAGEAQTQEGRVEEDALALRGEGDILPVGDVAPAPEASPLHGGVELQVGGAAIPELGVEPQHRPQGRKPLRQQGTEPVLLHPIGHDELLNVHTVPLPGRFPHSTTGGGGTQGIAGSAAA